ncbi:AAA family ATPase [Streptomyces sp. CHA1]|uniref:ATP-binding protein n=1 Tax=unclassified Streptomyces TaxID=2593676 RepID=UPI001BFCB84E|nr:MULTISPECIES: AAA family ATPase [unclassified Streptomyces]MBT3158182.1 AAA family ATPase [Streptomyces sp. G11C]MCO6699328.1 AAA family ATPase [Streptomyces sp. CHB9.2]MCO6705586.1 AAA family ATPase [Streptomyces sp. CHA3]MCO6711344.1 AAA family ATPase [Streptomyces sp. CHB19.2]MCO6717572.1 AAA family ATPase [Streptomyces sp. Vc714c-19]
MTTTPPPWPGDPLLERELELAAADRAVDALCRTRPEGGLLVYSGAAGIGKTSLLARVRARAEERCTVRTTRADPGTTAVPFRTARALFAPDLADTDGLGALLGPQRALVAPALGLTAPGNDPADPQGVQDGLVALAARAARRHRARPLVLVLDDAHWADGESLGWLAALGPRLARLPLLLVVAHRPTEHAAEESRPHLDALGTAARLRITLRALTPEAAVDLTRRALGPGADEALGRELWNATGGSPYELAELLARLSDHPLDPEADRAATVRELAATVRGRRLGDRLGDLGPDAVRLAWAAAVLGDGIPLLLAASLAGLSPNRQATATGHLCAARVLNPGDTVDFTHPLVAGAVYDAVPRSLRTTFHGRAARLLAAEGHSPAAAARHLLEVHPGRDPALVEQLRRAAREHLAVGAPDAARRCLERALREPPEHHLRALVHHELGCAALLTSPADTVRHLRIALELPGLDDTLRADATFRLAQALAHNQQMREASLSVAFAAATTEPGPERLRLQAAHFMYDAFRATEDDGPGRSRRLAQLADPLPGETNAERALLTLRAFDGMLRGENHTVVAEFCERALADGRPAPGLGWTDTAWGFEYPCLAGITYAWIDELDRAEGLFDEAVRAYEISGWSGGHLAFAHMLTGAVLRRRGSLAEAETRLRESLRLADRIGTGLPVHWDAVCLLVDTLLARGRTADAQRLAEAHGFGPPYPDAMILPDATSVHGRLLLALGRTDEAVAELEAASAMAERGRHNPVWAPWRRDLAAALAARDPERARVLTRRLRVDAERFGTPTALGVALGCEAALAPAGAAPALHARAVAHLEESPAQDELARARVALGLATGDRDQLHRGLLQARTCGADTLAEQARTALA